MVAEARRLHFRTQQQETKHNKFKQERRAEMPKISSYCTKMLELLQHPAARDGACLVLSYSKNADSILHALYDDKKI
jgi:hypothetical protein